MKRPWNLLVKIRRLRHDGIAIEIESRGAVDVRTISGRPNLLESLQNLRAWMMVHIARFHRNDGETGLYSSEQIGVGAAGTPMMCDFQHVSGRLLGRDEFSVPFSASASSRAEVFP